MGYNSLALGKAVEAQEGETVRDEKAR